MLAARPHIFRAMFQSNIGGVAGASDTWIDASRIVVDGVTGKTQSYVDYVDSSHLCTQLTPAAQCALPSASASFGGALVLPYAAAQFYDSNRSAALWGYQQDGSGCTQYAVWLCSSINLRTLHCSSSVATVNGMALYAASATTGPIYQVFKTAASNSVIVNSAQSMVPVNTPTYISASFSSVASPNWENRLKSALAASGAQAFTPGPGAAQSPLRIGAQPVTSASPFQGSHRASYFFHRVLRAAERAVVQSFIQKQTGITP